MLTQQQIQDDFGTAQMDVINIRQIYLDPPNNTMSKEVGQISLVFGQTTATADGDIPFEDDWELSPAVAQRFGYSRIKILAGSYTVTPSPDGDFGEVLINCQLFK